MLELFWRIAIFILAGGSVAMLIALGATAKPDFKGWRTLRASAMHWTGVILGSGLTCLLAYIWLFVGSSRADAESQMRVLFWLIVAFGLGTIVVGLNTRATQARAVRWRGQIIEFAKGRGAIGRQSLGDIKEMKSSPLGNVILRFKDDTRLIIDPYATGAEELLKTIADRLKTVDEE